MYASPSRLCWRRDISNGQPYGRVRSYGSYVQSEPWGFCPQALRSEPLLGVLANKTTHFPYKGTSLMGERTPLGPYRMPMPRVLAAS